MNIVDQEFCGLIIHCTALVPRLARGFNRYQSPYAISKSARMFLFVISLHSVENFQGVDFSVI
jgi:hypothetical protein